MSHVYEMIMTLGCMAFGAKIGFYGGDTVKKKLYQIFFFKNYLIFGI